jgi:hypothetical protein
MDPMMSGIFNIPFPDSKKPTEAGDVEPWIIYFNSNGSTVRQMSSILSEFQRRPVRRYFSCRFSILVCLLVIEN